MIPYAKNSLILAPMAGITDDGFRRICIKYGADIVYSEMVSSKGLFYNDSKSKELLNHKEYSKPISYQIFGSDVDSIKVATEFITSNYSPASICINMGCPAPKIFSNGDGSALMGNLPLASKIISTVKNNTNLPVSVKFRSGINDKSLNAVDFAKMCESSGADFITVHPRTREQFYSGKADWSVIKSVVESVSIPVIANGDITDHQSAQEVLEYTGAHSLMIGRAALGNPTIFAQIKNKLFNQNYNIILNLDIAIEHLDFVIEDKGEIIAVKEFRKHLMWYLKGIRNSAKLKQLSCKVNTRKDCIDVINTAKSYNI